MCYPLAHERAVVLGQHRLSSSILRAIELRLRVPLLTGLRLVCVARRHPAMRIAVLSAVVGAHHQVRRPLFQTCCGLLTSRGRCNVPPQLGFHPFGEEPRHPLHEMLAALRHATQRESRSLRFDHDITHRFMCLGRRLLRHDAFPTENLVAQVDCRCEPAHALEFVLHAGVRAGHCAVLLSPHACKVDPRCALPQMARRTERDTARLLLTPLP